MVKKVYETKFNKYCSTCKYWDNGNENETCMECLEVAFQVMKEKPIKYEAVQKKGGEKIARKRKARPCTSRRGKGT